MPNIPTPNPNFGTVGKSGVTRFGGTINEEWLANLQGDRARKVYREMSDNDPVIGAILFALEMLLRQVPWHVEAASDSEPDERAKVFLEECFNDMSTSWQSILSQILSMLTYGWAFLEVVYKRRVGETLNSYQSSQYADNRIGWADWNIRAQDTLAPDGWILDENNRVLGMKQMAPPDYSTVTIPANKGLLFRVFSPKDNPEGRSILRNAYRPWFLRKNIENIEAIGLERDLAGLPIVWVPQAILLQQTSEDIAAYNSYVSLVKNIRRDEQEGILMPLEYDECGNKIYDITLLTSGGKRDFETTQIINRYDQRITMSVLAEFLMLGQSSVGSYALSKNKSDMFSLAIEAILDAVEDVINRQAIPQLFKLNVFPEISQRPRYRHGDIGKPDLDSIANLINALSNSGAELFPDGELENYIRYAAGLPERPAEDDELGELYSGLNEAVQDEVAKIRKAQADE